MKEHFYFIGRFNLKSSHLVSLYCEAINVISRTLWTLLNKRYYRRKRLTNSLWKIHVFLNYFPILIWIFPKSFGMLKSFYYSLKSATLFSLNLCYLWDKNGIPFFVKEYLLYLHIFTFSLLARQSNLYKEQGTFWD